MEMEKCEDCGVQAELVPMTYEQAYMGEPATLCQDCADEVSQKLQESTFTNHWRG